MMSGMAYTYMLLCADRTLYVGSTTDLERRMSEHRVGLGSEYTRHRLPVQLVWYEQHDNVAHAFDREKQLQNWSRAKRLALIRGQLGDLPRLANTSQTPHPLDPPAVKVISTTSMTEPVPSKGHLDKLDDREPGGRACRDHETTRPRPQRESSRQAR